MENEEDNMLFLMLQEDAGIDFNNVLNVIEELAQPLPDEINERQNVVRNRNYYEATIPHYTDIQFKEHFRMSRASFAAST